MGANPIPPLYGRLAQRSEQWTHNPLVTGSNPVPPIVCVCHFISLLIPLLRFPVRSHRGNFFIYKLTESKASHIIQYSAMRKHLSWIK